MVVSGSVSFSSNAMSLEKEKFKPRWAQPCRVLLRPFTYSLNDFFRIVILEVEGKQTIFESRVRIDAAKKRGRESESESEKERGRM